MLTIVHALLADPAATYCDPGPDYHDQRTHTRRQARNHIRSLERLGYQVTIQAIHPAPANYSQPADPHTQVRRRYASPAAAARPAEVLFSDQPERGGFTGVHGRSRRSSGSTRVLR